MEIILLFILGILLGSFANVCIYRIPKDESIIRPASHCISCNAPIKWYDNIPILSFIFLKGKCRACGASISLQYPLVELITGLLFAVMAFEFHDDKIFVFYLIFTLILAIISFIDFFHKVIPDLLIYLLALSGLLASFFNNDLSSPFHARPLNALLGALVGFFSLYLIGFIGDKILKQETMGGGDIKLLAAIGMYLGWSKTLTTLFIAAILGSIFGMEMIASGKLRKREYIPFGPFIAISAYINLFLPDPTDFL